MGNITESKKNETTITFDKKALVKIKKKAQKEVRRNMVNDIMPHFDNLLKNEGTYGDVDRLISQLPIELSKEVFNWYKEGMKDNKIDVDAKLILEEIDGYYSTDNEAIDKNETPESKIQEGVKRYDFSGSGMGGKSKYAISFHNGKSKHKDGSDFFDIRLFSNKVDRDKFEQELLNSGYRYNYISLDESKNSKFDINKVEQFANAPTSGGGLDYYFDSEKNGVWEVGYSDAYGDEPTKIETFIPMYDILKENGWVYNELVDNGFIDITVKESTEVSLKENNEVEETNKLDSKLKEFHDFAYELGVIAGKNDEWMLLEDTIEEVTEFSDKGISEANDLLYYDQDEWETTDHFRLHYNTKLVDKMEEMFEDELEENSEIELDIIAEFHDGFWEGYAVGADERGVDLYAVAQKQYDLVMGTKETSKKEIKEDKEIDKFINTEEALNYLKSRPSQVEIYLGKYVPTYLVIIDGAVFEMDDHANQPNGINTYVGHYPGDIDYIALEIDSIKVQLSEYLPEELLLAIYEKAKESDAVDDAMWHLENDPE